MNNDLTLDMKIITNNSIDIKADGTDKVDLDVNVGSKEVDPIFTNSPAYTITYETFLASANAEITNKSSNMSGITIKCC